MPPSLKDPSLKVERAKEHLDVLYVRLVEFQKVHPFAVHHHEDHVNAVYVLQFEAPIIDPKLSIIAGDAMNSLRSALDHIAWQLALTQKDRPRTSTCFPIVGQNTPDNMKNFGSVTHDIPPDAVKEILSLQPYVRGAAYKSDPLWRLNRLCAIDKHRVIPSYGTAIESQIPKGVEHRYGTFNDKPAVFMPIAVSAKMRLAPPPTSDVIFGSLADELEVSFRELPTIYEYVRDTVFPRFSGFFPA